MTVQSFEGQLVASTEMRFAIVAARFNEFIVEQLVSGAIDAFRRHGVPESRLSVARVPGAFELPVVCRQIAQSGKVDAIVALGCVIRGATAHFEYVSGAATTGCAQVATSTGIPVIFGVLTTDSIEQAIERAGTKAGNKGAESAVAALEMVSLLRRLEEQGFVKR
ncbi:MAG: 6,7-dimethyl-8-ribityllumazine synthase [Polyangiales bacterium]